MPVLDPEFGVVFAWDVDLLSGYRHHLLDFSSVAERVRSLRWAVLDRKPLLLMGWFAPLVWAIWLMRIAMGAPTVVMSETTPGSFAFARKPPWRTALLRSLLRRSGAIACIGARNRAFMRSMGVCDERCISVPYSVDNVALAYAVERMVPRRADLRRQHGLDTDLPVFLFAGKLIEKKRPVQLLDAFVKGGFDRHAQLVFVGDGELRDTLDRRARAAGLRHVRMLGFFNQTQMPLAYALGDVLCLLSDARETWGLVVNEALACARPVVVSDAVGCADDLVNHEDGWIVPLDDQEALVATLQTALAARAAWPGMGLEGRRRVQKHTYAAMAAGLEKAIDTATRQG